MAFDKVIDSVQLENDLTVIADSIRAKAGTTEALTFPEGFKNAVDNIPTGGGDTEAIEQMIDSSGVLDSTEGTVEEKVEQLVDNSYIKKHIEESNRVSVGGLFREYKHSVFPRLDLSNKTDLGYFLYGANKIESINFYINSSSCKGHFYAFGGMVNLKFFMGVDCSLSTNTGKLFSDDVQLETIQEPLNFQNSTTTNEAFLKCYVLKNIRFVAETIKVSISFAYCYSLTAESIQSIIDGLAYVETAQTLTLHKDIVLTDEQKATINAKGWTLAQ